MEDRKHRLGRCADSALSRESVRMRFLGTTGRRRTRLSLAAAAIAGAANPSVLLALTLRDLRRLTTTAIPQSSNDWKGRVYSRLSALPEQVEPLQRALLAALSVGTEIIRLRRIARRFDLDVELDAALDALARGNSSVATERLGRLATGS
jgi:hypothetical protein